VQEEGGERQDDYAGTGAGAGQTNETVLERRRKMKKKELLE
jgi:hypothetical protein